MALNEMMNEMQQEAVCHIDGPLLILAGAGSGKTRVLTHRTAYLIDEAGVNPYNIMAITFTNKAVNEMRERIENIVGYGSESIWISTFHASCVRILRRYIDRIGFDTNFSIYDADDQKSLMKDICKRLQIDTKIYKERALLGAISSAKDELISPESFAARAQGDFTLRKQAEVYREYQEELHKNNALDFDDLIMKTVELLKTDAEVLHSYQERFRYIMVDEYQDTNTAQFVLIKLLAGKYRNLCVVGDDDQSIYKFRGANIYNILNFEKEFPDAHVIRLEQNYRSTQNILNAANGVIAHNAGRKRKRLWTQNGVGEKIAFHQFETAEEEAGYVADDILSQVRGGNLTYRDCAVLYRTNAQSRLFEERFIHSNIPYKIVGGVNFYARREIKDLLAYLKTIDNARDDLAVRRIINVPKRGIGAATLNRVRDYALQENLSFYDALKLAREIPSLGRGAAKIQPFVNFIQTMRSKAKYLGVKALLEEVLEETHYIENLEADNKEDAEQRIQNIDELISKAAAYEETSGETNEATLSGFLEEVALVADIDSVDMEQDYVVLMTLHSAKGLEFPQVYLAGMEEGLFPSYLSICSDNPTQEIEEERRLCYVGITRAKERLSVSCARCRMVRGETQFNRVSRFVREIPPELLSTEIRKEREPRNRKPNPGRMAKEAFRAQPMALSGKSAGNLFDVKNFAGNAAKVELSYGVGDRVRHLKFGEGTVRQIVEGGRDYEVTVEFDSAGVKKMFAVFAKLQKI